MYTLKYILYKYNDGGVCVRCAAAFELECVCRVFCVSICIANQINREREERRAPRVMSSDGRIAGHIDYSVCLCV